MELMKRSLSLCLLGLLWMAPSVSPAQNHHIFERWLVSMDTAEYAPEWVARFFVGGLSLEDESFIVASVEPSVSLRSLRTGRVIESTRLEGASQMTWRADGGQLFGADTKGYAYAIDQSSGKVQWKERLRGLFFVQPEVDERHVYFMNAQGQLAALERYTGEWVWQQTDPDASLFSLVSRHGLAFFEGRLLAGFPSGVLQAFQAHTGTRLWTDTFASAGVDSLGLNDLRALSVDGAYLAASAYGGDFRLWRAQAGSRQLLWEKSESAHTAPLIDAERGLIFVSLRSGKVQCLELETGYLRWEYELGRGLPTGVVTAGKHLWFGSSEGEVFVLNRDDGKLIARKRSLGSAIYQEPLVLSDHEAIVVTTRGVLRRLYMKAI